VSSFYKRYKEGECQEVWTELVNYGQAIRDDARMLEDAVSVARETMSRARYNIELLIERLRNIKYVFVVEELYETRQPYTPPDSEIIELINSFEATAGFLPLSVKTFFTKVGMVNFMGAHPYLSEYTDFYVEYKLKELSDPLCFGFDPIDLEISRNGRLEFPTASLEKQSHEFEIAPDIFHKANYSGGAAYTILLPDGAADAKLHYWQGKGTFVDYLRVSFKWGGFAGIASINDGIGSYKYYREVDLPLPELAYLTEGLLSL
jgi:hypothetical protein